MLRATPSPRATESTPLKGPPCDQPCRPTGGRATSHLKCGDASGREDSVPCLIDLVEA